MVSDFSPFYSRFVDEGKLASIEDKKERRRYHRHAFFVAPISMVPALLATLVGFDFTHPFAIAIFALMVLFYLLSLWLVLSLWAEEKKCGVYRKKIWFWLFNGVYFLLSVGGCVSAYFNTEFHSLGTGFSISINPAYFLLVILPLWIAYTVFAYYAYGKCFAKYAR